MLVCFTIYELIHQASAKPLTCFKFAASTLWVTMILSIKKQKLKLISGRSIGKITTIFSNSAPKKTKKITIWNDFFDCGFNTINRNNCVTPHCVTQSEVNL